MTNYAQRPEKLLKTGIYTAFITLLFSLGPITGPIAMFGPVEAAKMAFPTFSEVRYIVAGEVLNRFDAIAVLFWTVGL
ncbi:GerAB/ArcD/ProY family transporter [Bacillus sp. DJP31]|uniref:GerAB/ArcD/ProY family transporter n=1 Tax=Bacillus sp. DJP31 TaxID=3409789 RepID=UPI003BB69C31